jgi:hypothetical protein
MHQARNEPSIDALSLHHLGVDGESEAGVGVADLPHHPARVSTRGEGQRREGATKRVRRDRPLGTGDRSVPGPAGGTEVRGTPAGLFRVDTSDGTELDAQTWRGRRTAPGPTAGAELDIEIARPASAIARRLDGVASPS